MCSTAHLDFKDVDNIQLKIRGVLKGFAENINAYNAYTGSFLLLPPPPPQPYIASIFAPPNMFFLVLRDPLF